MAFNLHLKPYPGELFCTTVRSGKMGFGVPGSLKMGWFMKHRNRYIALNCKCPKCGGNEVYHNDIPRYGDRCSKCHGLVEDFVSLTE